MNKSHKDISTKKAVVLPLSFFFFSRCSWLLSNHEIINLTNSLITASIAAALVVLLVRLSVFEIIMEKSTINMQMSIQDFFQA